MREKLLRQLVRLLHWAYKMIEPGLRVETDRFRCPRCGFELSISKGEAPPICTFTHDEPVEMKHFAYRDYKGSPPPR